MDAPATAAFILTAGGGSVMIPTTVSPYVWTGHTVNYTDGGAGVWVADTPVLVRSSPFNLAEVSPEIEKSLFWSIASGTVGLLPPRRLGAILPAWLDPFRPMMKINDGDAFAGAFVLTSSFEHSICGAQPGAEVGLDIVHPQTLVSVWSGTIVAGAGSSPVDFPECLTRVSLSALDATIEIEKSGLSRIFVPYQESLGIVSALAAGVAVLYFISAASVLADGQDGNLVFRNEDGGGFTRLLLADSPGIGVAAALSSAVASSDWDSWWVSAQAIASSATAVCSFAVVTLMLLFYRTKTAVYPDRAYRTGIRRYVEASLLIGVQQPIDDSLEFAVSALVSLALVIVILRSPPSVLLTENGAKRDPFVRKLYYLEVLFSSWVVLVNAPLLLMRSFTLVGTGELDNFFISLSTTILFAWLTMLQLWPSNLLTRRVSQKAYGKPNEIVPEQLPMSETSSESPVNSNVAMFL